MTLYGKFLCFILIYLISDSKWVLVQSSESSPANPNPGTGTQEGTSVTTPAAGGNNSRTKTGVELSLKATSGTNEFDYKKSGNIVTYTAKDGFGFKSVKTGDTVVWSTDNASEYASKVVLDGKGKKEKTITIDKLDDNKVVCVREGKDKPWQVYDLSKTNKVSINIGFKSDSFKYTNKLDGQIRTFEAKDKFIFNHVRCYINKNWIDIWKTSDENECSKKVVVEGDIKVTIYIGEGDNATTKVFKKDSDGIWTEDTASSKKGSGTDGSGGTDQSGGGTTGTDPSRGSSTPASPRSGGTTGTDPSGGGGTQQSTPATR